MPHPEPRTDSTARAPGVTVTAPARLHLGFLDLHGGLGRRFGSVGLALDEPRTRVHLRPARTLVASGPSAERAAAYARVLSARLGLDRGAHIRVDEAIPEHAGLGSGTQLALAVGTALATAFELDLTPREVAQYLDRGARSGIGLSAFELGGFLVDGGRGAGDAPPPLVCRSRFPPAWRMLLVFDDAGAKMHGEHEMEAFAALPEFSAEAAGQTCRLVLMQALPALAEGDVRAFGAALTELQRRIGEHFAAVQGGRFSSPRVAGAIEWLARNGAAGVGQTSWGPTGFALCESEAEAQRLMRAAAQRFGSAGALRFQVCRSRNEPGTVRIQALSVAG